jgi:HEAT repeat protein
MSKFQPGQSGNPGGRPKGSGAVRDLARQYTEHAIQALVANLVDGNGMVRNTAAQALLDRGWGKPAQAITGEDGGAVDVNVKLSDLDVARRIAFLLSRGAKAAEQGNTGK